MPCKTMVSTAMLMTVCSSRSSRLPSHPSDGRSIQTVPSTRLVDIGGSDAVRDQAARGENDSARDCPDGGDGDWRRVPDWVARLRCSMVDWRRRSVAAPSLPMPLDVHLR